VIRWPADSLALRIFLHVGLTMLVATLALIAMVLVEFRDHVNSLQDRTLLGQAADIARYLNIDAAGEVRLLLPVPLASAYEARPHEFQYAVLTARGEPLFPASAVAAGLTETRASDINSQVWFQFFALDMERKFIAASVYRKIQGRAFTIQVAQSSSHGDVLVDTVIEEFLEDNAWVLLLVYAAILGVIYLTVRSALKPLKAVSSQAADITPNSFDVRLPTVGIAAEIQPMVLAMNQALDRLQEGYRTQQEFTANAAHEIRTPLAVLRAHIEAGVEHSEAKELLPDLARLERIVAQLLNLAQMDNLSRDEFTTVNLHTIAVECAAQLAPLAIRNDKKLAVTGARNVCVRGNQAVLAAALRNLLENAIYYSGEGRDIEIRVSDSPAVSVLDRGSGIAAGDSANLFKRFWRGNHNRQGGAGLGLSIVATIARAHQAQVSVATRASGGTSFTIAFPSPPVSAG